MEIVLATINARYAHSAMALRCLRANLGALEARSRIVEFVLGVQTEVAAQEILRDSPRIVALSVYIWNVDELTRLAAMLRTLAPQLLIVIGGPEVSHEHEQQAIVKIADFLILGAAERRFAQLCAQLLALPGQPKAPLSKVLAGDGLIERGSDLQMPYRLYDDEDIRHRYIYVEASRGCPYQCEFCLSSLDRTAVAFDATRLLGELDSLYARGARNFKFIDRTFNLKVEQCVGLLEFFLERIARAPQQPMLLHFELIPDHLPQRLRELIARFPPSTLQFEIGIQTWNPQVQQLISRRQDDLQAESNIAWLREHTNAHLHVDLIAGLPGESMESFAAGFDRLLALRPHEIQVGVLKRLRGTPISRHAEPYQLRFNPFPPYNVLSTNLIGFAQMQAIARFARYWDLIGNSGHYRHSLSLILDDARSAFTRFWSLSEWIHARSDRTHRIAAPRLYQWVEQWLQHTGTDAFLARDRVDRDRAERGIKTVASATGAASRPVAASAARAGRPTPLRNQRGVEPVG